MRIQTG